MDGVIILNTVEVTKNTAGFSLPGLLLAILAVAALVIAVICAIDGDGDFIIFFILMALCTALATMGFIHANKVFDHYEYQAIVDESVSMVEFNKKYEIVKQEGLIFTIRERDIDG